jgi:hypothetical protein
MVEERDELVSLIAREMPGWNDDTTEPDEPEGPFRDFAEAHWERVNEECKRQAGIYADVVLSWVAARDKKVRAGERDRIRAEALSVSVSLSTGFGQRVEIIETDWLLEALAAPREGDS